MNDQQIEKEIVEKGKTAPRVTPDHIEGIIAQEAYFTAEDGAFGKAIKAKHTGGEVNYQSHESLSLLTFCVLVLRNGFTVTGERVPVQVRKILMQKLVGRLPGRML